MAWLSRLAFSNAPLALRNIDNLLSGRAYGSAAAAAVQYDYDYEDEYCYSDAEEYQRAPRLDSAVGSTPGRGVQWVFIGDPRAEKNVYAEKLSKLLEVPHISMGKLVRQELNPRSSLYKQIANAVNEGKLVPEDVIFGLLTKRLEEGYYKGESGFILDGIPRTRLQAEILDQIADVDLVVNFKSVQGLLVKRNSLSIGSSGSSVVDAGSASKEKFHIFAEQGKALEEYYGKQNKLLNFQVAGAPGETWQGLLAALNLKHLSAVNSTQKLVA